MEDRRSRHRSITPYSQPVPDYTVRYYSNPAAFGNEITDQVYNPNTSAFLYPIKTTKLNQDQHKNQLNEQLYNDTQEHQATNSQKSKSADIWTIDTIITEDLREAEKNTQNSINPNPVSGSSLISLAPPDYEDSAGNDAQDKHVK